MPQTAMTHQTTMTRLTHAPATTLLPTAVTNTARDKYPLELFFRVVIMGNGIRTAALLGLLSGFFVVCGTLLAGPDGALAALFFAALMNVFAYFFSDKIVLMMYGAKEISEPDNPRLHRIVEGLAKKAGIPKPKVYMINQESPNAFATGRGPGHAAVAVTKGIMRILPDNEIEAVLAHEIAHIKNRDILISSIAATIAGAISWLASMSRYALIFGGSRDDRRGGNNLIGLLFMMILAPIIAMVIKLAISRTREYGADYTGAMISGNPEALASALEKISGIAQAHPMSGNGATAHMFIVNPFSAQGMMSLLSTHPPVEERVARLRGMKI